MSTYADLAIVLGQEPTPEQWDAYKRGDGPLFDMPCNECGKDGKNFYALRCGAEYYGASFCTRLRGHTGEHYDRRTKCEFSQCYCHSQIDRGKCFINNGEGGDGSPEYLAALLSKWRQEYVCYDCRNAKEKAQAAEELRILDAKRDIVREYLGAGGVSAQGIEPENDSDRPNEGGQWFRVSIFVPNDWKFKEVA